MENKPEEIIFNIKSQFDEDTLEKNLYLDYHSSSITFISEEDLQNVFTKFKWHESKYVKIRGQVCEEIPKNATFFVIQEAKYEMDIIIKLNTELQKTIPDGSYVNVEGWILRSKNKKNSTNFMVVGAIKIVITQPDTWWDYMRYFLSDELPTVDIKKTEYLKSLYDNPDKYNGLYIKIGGQAFSDIIYNPDLDHYMIQMESRLDGNLMVFLENKDSFGEIYADEYLLVEGIIRGEYCYENEDGESIEAVVIYANKIEKTDHLTAFCLKSIVGNFQIDADYFEQTYIVKIDKFIFLDGKTLVYYTITNDSYKPITSYGLSWRIVQNRRQYNPQNIDSVTLYPKTDYKGKIIFPAIDAAETFRLYVNDKDYTIISPYLF